MIKLLYSKLEPLCTLLNWHNKLANNILTKMNYSYRFEKEVVKKY